MFKRMRMAPLPENLLGTAANAGDTLFFDGHHFN